MPAPLHDLRVLDLAGLPGAWCGRLLADAGAGVQKIEPPGGDPMRRLGPFFRDEGDPAQSLVHWHYDTGKQSRRLDLHDEGGRQALLELVRGADVMIETFAPGTLDALGLGWRHLSEIAPRLVLVSLTPFGQTGPRRHWRASDTVAQALGGMAWVNGHPSEAPLRGFGLQAYHSASTYAAIAVLLALMAREQSGRGAHVDVSLQASVAATVEHVSGFYHQTGTIEERRGSLHWSRYFRVGRCRDGHVLHCTLGDWTSLVEWVKGEGMAEDLDGPEWEDFAHRKKNCARVFDVLDRWAAAYQLDDLVEGAQLRRVPYAPVRPLETLATNPQLRERQFLLDVHHEDLGVTAQQPRGPFRLAPDPDSPPTPPPPTAPATRLRALPPLRALRVSDFTWVVAGPVATRILCDQGAEVIKIERRDSLDFGSRRGGLTGNLNRGKQSVVLDMSHPEGLAIARELIARADVVIDNFSARVMPNWGLDYDALRRLNPGIIAVAMSGFGRTGPWRDWVSYGPTLQALTGFTDLMRHPGGEPAGWGFSYADMVAGYSAALAVLMALWQRRRTGEGQFVDLAQFETLAAVIGAPLLAVLAKGEMPRPSGNRSPEGPAAPHGIYRCADRPPDRAGTRSGNDRWCAITVFGEDEWVRFVEAIGAPAWSRDPRFATLEARLRHQEDLDGLVESWTRGRDAEEVMNVLQSAGVAAGLVADAEDLCARDPQMRHRGYWVDVATPEGETVRLDGVPFRIGDHASGPRAPGPLLGEHTDAVLRRVLGMGEERITALRAAGAIA